ncbi:MAG TPA: tetratricopeptide repeat protein, partial [Planctomycetaceae bacterium]|nr:tetratricopeptide repeat protein [Planctomycetaceae bacterium]
ALEHNAQVLADRTLSQDQRTAAQLQRAEILLRMGKIQDCLDTLDSFSPHSARWGEALVLKGWAKLEEARQLVASGAVEAAAEVQENYREAIRILDQARDQSTAAAPRALYLSGLALAERGQLEEAIQQLTRVGQNYPDSPEALAAGLYAARLQRQIGRGADAAELYRRVLSAVDDPRTFTNPWVSVEQVRDEALEAFEEYFRRGQFDTALALADALRHVVPQWRVVELKAQTHRAWGRHLLEQASRLPYREAQKVTKTARRRLRRAGATYTVLAQLRMTTRAYPDDLWSAAECYFQGQNYSAASALLGRYLEDQPRHRRARALLLLGSSVLALGRAEEALRRLEQCIQFYPHDPAAFQARLVAAAAHRELGQPEEAESLLRENLEGDFLTPASAEWRDSLFALGTLLHARGQYEEAARQLEEAISRYPEDPQALEARYLLGDCHYRTARQMESQRQAEVVPQRRAAWAEQATQHWVVALEHFQRARQQLEEQGPPEQLSPDGKAMLRNCYFAIGGIQFDLGRYQAAVETYRQATYRFEQSPIVLEAYVQIARAYQRLNQLDEARRTLWEAKQALARIQKVEDLATTTNRTREEWLQLLDQLAQRLDNLARIGPYPGSSGAAPALLCKA